MGLFRKSIKHSKSSKDLDNKIKNLDEDLKKTGVTINEGDALPLPEEKPEDERYDWRKDLYEGEVVKEDLTEEYVSEIREKHRKLCLVEDSIESLKIREAQSIFRELYQDQVEQVVEKYVSSNSADIVTLREDLFLELSKKPKVDLSSLEERIDLLAIKYKKLSEGLLNDPSKNSDPLSQNPVTLEQLKNHYQLLVGRLQEQLATLGGGGEVRLEFLDDVDRNTAKTDGYFLQYQASTGKWIGAVGSGGGGGGVVGSAGTWGVDTVGINTVKNVGIGTTAKDGYKLYVEGDTRVTGILTVGPASITLNGIDNEILVGSGVTIYGNTGIVSATDVYSGGEKLQNGIIGINTTGISYLNTAFISSVNASDVSTFNGEVYHNSNVNVGTGITLYQSNGQVHATGFYVNGQEITGGGEGGGAQGTQGIQGIQGIQGETGTGTQGATGAGTQGTQGIQGIIGVQGTTGTQGPSDGADGAQGTQGTQGTAGFSGSNGAQGATGSQGVQGTRGQLGIDGTQGTQGTSGTSVQIQGSVTLNTDLPGWPNSYSGSIGDGYIVTDTGNLWVWNGSSWDDVGNITGPQGAQGADGPIGTQGLAGIGGIQGLQGTDGSQGTQGTQGFFGPQGVQGPSDGATGAQGIAGLQGAQGTQGIQGFAGNNGTQGAQGFIGSQGVSGPGGLQGLQGSTGTGSQGTIGAQGTTGIQGDTGGAQGAQGTDGLQGAIGVQGATGTQGPSDGADGAQGTQGPSGPQGTDGTQGATGAGTQGATGAQGTDGTQGVQGITGTQGTAAAGVNGKILQVASTLKTNTYAATVGTTWTNVTNLAASFTPSATSSTVLVMVHLTGASADRMFARVTRNGTVIGVGDAASNRIQCANGSPFYDRGDSNEAMEASFILQDSPSTTSSVNYQVQVRCTSGGSSAYINRCRADGDDAGNPRGTSSITILEIGV